MKFSERLGIAKVNDVIQIDGMNSELRNSLWNVYYQFYGESLTHSGYSVEAEKVGKMFETMWRHYWNQAFDMLPDYRYEMLAFTKKFFFECQWWEIYDFLENIINVSKGFETYKFILELNKFLTIHLSGYRCINHQFVPITSNT